jgi:multiple sugar transport system permease protein
VTSDVFEGSPVTATTRPMPVSRLLFSRQMLPRSLLRHIVLLLLAACMLYPVIWMVFSSFGTSAEALSNTGLLRSHWTASNYTTGWTLFPGLTFTELFLNSLLISVSVVVGSVASCTMAAYAFAKLRFRLRGVLFGLTLITVMLPTQVLIIPQYIVFHKVGWINTFLPLIVPSFFAVNGFYIFLLVQFIRGVPQELTEAAQVDGAGHFYVFRRIIVPLAAPAMATVGLFSFVATWNEFLGPLLYLTSPTKFTVPLGLDSFINSGTTGGASAIGPLFAMCTLSLAPVIGVFLAAQRFLSEGISTTGIK